MGTSRPLSVTTTSTIAILTAGALTELARGARNYELTSASSTLAVLVGGFLLVFSLLRLGIAASFISEPVLVGFKAGVGLVIVVDQLPKLLGIHFDKGPFLHNVVSTAEHLAQASLATVVLAGCMLGLQIGLQRFFPRAPASLITVAAGIAAAAVAGLDRRGVEFVGSVEAGLPAFIRPDPALFEPLWPAAIGIALMSFVESIAAGQAFRNTEEPRPEPNKELLALGLANVIGGLFHNMPSGGGTSQTAVNRRAGAHSQIAGLMPAAVVRAVLYFRAPLVAKMPQATLAAVVIVPCAGMIHVDEFRAILRNRAMEFSWAVIAMAGVVVVGTLRGIIVAVALSLLALVYHASMRPVFVLGRKPGTDVFRPRSKDHPEDESFPGLLLVRTEGAMHFANAQRVGNMMWRLIHEHRPRVIALDCSAVPDFEYTALKMLTEAEKKLRLSGISLWLVALNPEPLRLVQKSALGKALGRERMHFTVEQAVRSYLRQSRESGLAS